LVEAFHVPKLLSQQLLPFGRSGDGLGVLTFGVVQFSALSVPRGRSAWTWRTVRVVRVRRMFFVFFLGFVFDPSWFQVLVGQGFGRSACSGRTVRGCLADSPCAPRGRSVIRGASLEVLLPFSESAAQAGRSAARARTVRDTRPDSPRGLCGQSASPGRTVRQSLAALFLGSIPPSFFRASVCASRNRS
jgi:hypothetical protein